MLDFGALPPEINSGRLYAGPGAGPIAAAAAAWDVLGAELAAAASGYSSVIAELTSGAWAGPTASTMAAAVTPYVSWLRGLAEQAEETAGQARAAAAAFETAFALTVPPPVIVANRALLATLVATNFLGQNTPAIAATEAEYAQMWAQDAGAMYGYAGSSLAASKLSPIAEPPNTTAADAAPDQALAVGNAQAQPASSAAQTVSNATAQAGAQLAAAAPGQQATTAATETPGSLSWLQNLIQNFAQSGLPTPDNNYLGLNPTVYTVILKQTSSLAYQSNGLANFGWSIAQQLTYGPGGETAGSAGAWFPTPQFASLGLGNLAGGGGLGQVGGGAAAAAGQAARVGMLSVPHQWTTLTSAMTPVVAESQLSAVPAGPIGAVGAGGADSPNALLRGMPVGAMGRRGATAGYVNRYGFRYGVLSRPPSAG